jgi:NAD/NADP transhydrogenase alpha subunit
VVIDGTCNYASELIQLSSELFSQNCFAFIENLCGKSKSVDGLIEREQGRFDLSDVIVRQSLVVNESTIMYPPPAMEIQTPQPQRPAVQVPIAPVVGVSGKYSEEILLVAGAAALGALGLTADMRTVRLVGDFVLSCVIGHFTVSSVTPALHTPLISVTNALSGIIVVGGMLEMGPGVSPQSMCALSAVLVSLVNVSGGFAVTDRMLSMFKSINNRS